MKNYDLLKVVASKLNGLQYPRDDEIKELREQCKKDGIVICYGASDDLMELDGAIYNEYDVWEGGTVCFDENGNEASANNYYPITAIWGQGNTSWQYEFAPKHEEFTIYEDDEVYCIGIVFFADDLKKKKKEVIELPYLNEIFHQNMTLDGKSYQIVFRDVDGIVKATGEIFPKEKAEELLAQIENMFNGKIEE